MLTVLPDSLMCKIGQHWKSTDYIRVGRVNRELHNRVTPILHEVSVVRIKRFMVWAKTFASIKFLAKSFLRCNLSEADTRLISFKDFNKRLRETRVIRSVKMFVDRLSRRSYNLRLMLQTAVTDSAVTTAVTTAAVGNADSSRGGITVNIRAVIVSFMARYYPTLCFESMGELETAVFESSLVFTDCLYAMASHLVTPGNSFHNMPRDLVETFPSVLMSYYGDFMIWKPMDAARLVARIANALHALRVAVLTLPVDMPANAPVRLEFQIQFARLRAKMLEIGGEDGVAAFIVDAREELDLA